VVERIVWAWIFTLPATALIGYMLERAIGAHWASRAVLNASVITRPTSPRTPFTPLQRRTTRI